VLVLDRDATTLELAEDLDIALVRVPRGTLKTV